MDISAEAIIEHWTDDEIRRVRRLLAYHQHRSLRTISANEARAFMDEQQRRRVGMFGQNCARWRPGSGFLSDGKSQTHPAKAWNWWDEVLPNGHLG